MTDFRLTQALAEEWAVPAGPDMQLSQILIEQWAQVNVLNPQFILTQALVEQWASVAEAASATAQARAAILA